MMNTEGERVDGILELEGKHFHYQILYEQGKKFVKIANILFERNRKLTLLKDISKTLLDKKLI